MKELFLKTEHGLQSIDEKIIEKYNLSEGKISPFSRCEIIDKNGNLEINKHYEGTPSPGLDEMPEGEGLDNDEIEELSETHVILSQSEIIDFSHGTDSE